MELQAGPPDCAACPAAWPCEANQGAWEVFWAVADLLGDDWGGVNLDNARLAALALGYDWDAAMLAKTTTLIRLFLKKVDLPEEDGSTG